MRLARLLTLALELVAAVPRSVPRIRALSCLGRRDEGRSLVERWVEEDRLAGRYQPPDRVGRV